MEGLQREEILRVEDEVPDVVPANPQFGKPQDLGPQQIDPTRIGTRQVHLKSVNWEPPA